MYNIIYSKVYIPPYYPAIPGFRILVTLAHGINKSWLAERLPEPEQKCSGSLSANQKAGIRWAGVTNSHVVDLPSIAVVDITSVKY